MIKPIEDLIATMKAEGWPEPSVTSGNSNVDGSGIERIVLQWPRVSAMYEVGHGWTDIIGELGGVCPMPFGIAVIDQGYCPYYLKRFAATMEQRKEASNVNDDTNAKTS